MGCAKFIGTVFPPPIDEKRRVGFCIGVSNTIVFSDANLFFITVVLGISNELGKVSY